MRKIGGVNMEAVARLRGKLTKEKAPERYCGIYKSLEESLKEVKLIKEGKIKAKDWRQLLEELKENEG